MHIDRRDGPVLIFRRFNMTALLTLCVVLTVVGILILLASSDYFSNDAAQSWSVVSNLLQGRGLKTSVIYYEVQAAQGLPAHQTVWPPGLPLLAAGLAWSTGIDGVRAIATLNALAHGATAILIYWLVWCLRRDAIVAAAVAIGYTLYSLSLKLALMGASEPLFVLTVVASVACIAKAFDEREEGSMAWLAVAAVAIGAGSWFRYQAIFHIVPLGLVCLFTLARRASPWRAMLGSVLACLPAVVAFGALILRNWYLTGTITGGPSSLYAQTTTHLLFQAKWAVLGLLGYGGDWFVPFTAIALCLAGLACIWTLARDNSSWRWPSSMMNWMVGFYGVASAIATTGMILMLDYRSNLYGLQTRYLLPSALLMVIAVVALWPRWNALETTQSSSLLAARAFALAAALLIAAQLGGIASLLSNGGDLVKIRQALAKNHEGTLVEEFLRTSASRDTPVMSNQSQLLHLVLERPTIGVPQSRLTPRVWMPDDILSTARRFGIVYLAIFRKMPDGSVDGATDYLLKLAEKPSAELLPLLVTDELALYRIAKK